MIGDGFLLHHQESIIFCHFVQVASSTKGMTLVINENVKVGPIYIARSCVQVGATSPRTRRRKQPKTNTQPSHTHLIPLIIKLSIVCVCLPFWPTPFRVSWLHFSAQSADEYIEDQIKQKQCNKSRNLLACSYTLAPSSRRDTSVCLYAYIVYNLRRIGALFIRRLRWIHTLEKENERDSQLCFLSFYPFLTASVGSSSLRVTWASSSFFCTLFTRYVIFQR